MFFSYGLRWPKPVLSRNFLDTESSDFLDTESGDFLDMMSSDFLDMVGWGCPQVPDTILRNFLGVPLVTID
ncbi:hypothetical protein F4V58_00415 [Corynebacterium phocae]|nr:hypothetical protein F4V58_00415 [Corynebacterium phocae]